MWPDECYAAYWWWEFDPLMESKDYVIPAWPMGDDLKAEEALQIATEAFMPEAAKIFSDEALAHTYPLKPSIHFKGDDGDYSKRYWVVDFQTDWGTGSQYTDNLVTLDARTGEVLEMELSSQQGNG